MKREYYEAYEDRYKDVYQNNILWETSISSKDIIDTIITSNNLNIIKIRISENIPSFDKCICALVDKEENYE